MKTEESIFSEALDMDSLQARAEYLENVCGSDSALRARVENLLRSHEHAGSFLRNPPAATLEEPARERPGTVIGPYKLLEQIGEGGMGVVFMAEQSVPIQRKVAVKIIKPGMDTQQVIARFEAERQALALMDHPYIAKVLDAGTTASGRPYFVMELVRGMPVTEFCDQKTASVRDRLELFITICQAVQHAHQKGIIHRDIKPTNVLITLHDGRPVIKVIDFGVAKATGQKLTDRTLFTGFTQMVGTPLYMSPEQAELCAQDVDTRSDIYSLGVLLYELLTGTTPFDKERLKTATFDELRRIIREEDPPRPSTRLSTLAQHAISTVSTQRSSDPRHLSRLFQGELDWIVMKSLEKDRNRRYESASALAADVEHYLHDEPVLASPPSARYRMRKFLRRNKGKVLAGTLVLATITVAAVTSAVVIAKAYQREVAGRKQADESLNFVVSALRSPDPQRDGRTIRVAELLDRSAKELQGKFSDDPLTKAKLLKAVGDSYWGLGLNREGIPLLEQARDLYTAVLGPEDLDTSYVKFDLAELYWEVGRYDEGFALFEEVFRVLKAKLGADDPNTLNAMRLLASRTVDRSWEKAVPLLRELLNLQKAKLGAEHLDTLSTAAELVSLDYSHGGNSMRLGADAERTYEKLLKRQRAELGANDGATFGSMTCLVQLYMINNKLDEAIPLCEELVKREGAMLGLDHPITVTNRIRLAECYGRKGRLSETVSLVDELIKVKGRDRYDLLLVSRELLTAYIKGTEAAGKAPPWDELLAEFVHGIDVTPDDSKHCSFRKRVCSDLAHYDDLFNQVAKLRPKETTVWVGRGQYRALRGEWHLAASDLARVVRDRPLEDDGTFEYAGLLILDGDLTGYKKFCQELKARFKDQPSDAYTAFVVSRAFAVGPIDTVDVPRVIDWSERAIRGDHSTWVVHNLGLAQFRAGQYRAAIENLQKAAATGWGGQAADWLLQAMIHDRLGHTDEARRCIEKAKELTKEIAPVSGEDEARIACTDWIELNVLMREAEKLLKSTP
jgi:eukaryotic-like serine/threonine-protein kinase